MGRPLEEVVAFVHEKRPDHERLSQGLSPDASRQSVRRVVPAGYRGIPRKRWKRTRSRAGARGLSGELPEKPGGSPDGWAPPPLRPLRASKTGRFEKERDLEKDLLAGRPRRRSGGPRGSACV